jgi:CRP-like cAMP-binding protein
VLADHQTHCRDLLGASFNRVKLRLVRVLLDQVRHFGVPHGEPGWVHLVTDLTHEDIAALVTATRVAISKGLAELRQEGMIEGGRGRYRLNAPALAALLGE